MNKKSLVIKKLNTDDSLIKNTNISLRCSSINFIIDNTNKSSTFFKSILNMYDSTKQAFLYQRPLDKSLDYVGYYSKSFDIYKDIKVINFFKYSNSFYKNNYQDNVVRLLNIFNINKDSIIKSLTNEEYEIVKLIDTIYHKPELILLDKPYQSLSLVNIEKLNNELLNLKENNSTILISNNSINYLYDKNTNFFIFNDSELVDIKSLGKKKITINFKSLDQISFKIKLLSFEQNDDIYTINYIGPIHILFDSLVKYSVEILSIEAGDIL